MCNNEDGSHITIYEQGAHITSWQTQNNEEHLYTSSKAIYQDGKAIRGGVPLIFPQFSDIGPLPVSHGFLRVRANWRVISDTQAGQDRVVILQYRLRPGEEPSYADADCTLRYTITFNANTLRMEMAVHHEGGSSSPLVFAFAFHSYFAVTDVRAVSVSGLDQTPYLDNLQARKRCAPAPIAAIEGEVDRIYIDHMDGPVQLRYPVGGNNRVTKTVSVRGDNFRDVVLWNPWVEKTKTMSDMPEEDYLRFVCVEHGTILEKVQLAPKQTWTAAQIVSISHDHSTKL